MHGFEAGDTELLTPPIRVEEVTRDVLLQLVAAMVIGATPEEIVGYLDGEFPDEVASMLDRPLERDEMNAHVDLLLGALQTTGLAQAA